MVGFWDANKLFWKNYVNFQGRATRAEFWWPTLLNTLIFVGLFAVMLAGFDYDNLDTAGEPEVSGLALFAILALLLFYLATLLPILSVHVRRLHDFNATGWLVLIALVIGFPASIVFGCIPGTPGPNKYGGDDADNAEFVRETFA